MHEIAENFIKDHEYRLRLVVKGMKIGVWDWDVRTGDLFWSKEFIDLLGIREDEFRPEYEEFRSRLHPDDIKLLEEKLKNHLEDHAEYDLEFRLRHKDGHYLWIHACGQATWDEEGNPIAMVGSVADISFRKHSEDIIQKYLLELQTSNQELNDFSYIASHDLKEPLRGISNNAQFLKEDYQDILDKDAIKRIDRIVYLCDRMEGLTNDLLHFSKIGNQELAIKKTDLNQIIEDITHMLDIDKDELKVKFSIPKKLPNVICDSIKITEVFRNLITNAIKYNNKEEKTIEIGCKEGVFYIKDNGFGISDKHYKDVFRIFKRLNHEKDDIKGSGVGLTFVKKIIEKHGGSIWLESKLGEGTIFYFTIPNQKLNRLK